MHAPTRYDWQQTRRHWTEAGHATPPVMITVANRTETAARVKHAFDSNRIYIKEPDRTESFTSTQGPGQAEAREISCHRSPTDSDLEAGREDELPQDRADQG